MVLVQLLLPGASAFAPPCRLILWPLLVLPAAAAEQLLQGLLPRMMQHQLPRIGVALTAASEGVVQVCPADQYNQHCCTHPTSTHKTALSPPPTYPGGTTHSHASCALCFRLSRAAAISPGGGILSLLQPATNGLCSSAADPPTLVGTQATRGTKGSSSLSGGKMTSAGPSYPRPSYPGSKARRRCLGVK